MAGLFSLVPVSPPPDASDVTLSKIDSALLDISVKDGRAPFGDIERQLGVSRAYARVRVQALVSNGVIELFGAVINPEKLGKVISNLVDIRVAPAALEAVAQVLADCHEVVSLYIMSDLQSLHTFGEGSSEACALCQGQGSITFAAQEYLVYDETDDAN